MSHPLLFLKKLNILFCSDRNYRPLPTEDPLPFSVAADGPSFLRPSHALPRSLPLLHQHLQHRHQRPQHVGLIQIPHLLAAALLQQPDAELPVQLLPVLRHRLRLLPVLHGGPGEHWRRALPDSPIVLFRGHGHRRCKQLDESGPEHPE